MLVVGAAFVGGYVTGRSTAPDGAGTDLVDDTDGVSGRVNGAGVDRSAAAPDRPSARFRSAGEGARASVR